MTNSGKSWQKLSSASDQFRKVLLNYCALVIRWSTSAKVLKKCMKRWLGNVRLRWPPSAKVPKRWRTFDPKRSRCEPKFWILNQNSGLFQEFQSRGYARPNVPNVNLPLGMNANICRSRIWSRIFAIYENMDVIKCFNTLKQYGFGIYDNSGMICFYRRLRNLVSCRVINIVLWDIEQYISYDRRDILFPGCPSVRKLSCMHCNANMT